jgi:hypothetical protein
MRYSALWNLPPKKKLRDTVARYARSGAIQGAYELDIMDAVLGVRWIYKFRFDRVYPTMVSSPVKDMYTCADERLYINLTAAVRHCEKILNDKHLHSEVGRV